LAATPRLRSSYGPPPLPTRTVADAPTSPKSGSQRPDAGHREHAAGWPIRDGGCGLSGCRRRAAGLREQLFVRAAPQGSDRGQPADAADLSRRSASSPADRSPGNARSSPSHP